MNGGLGSWVCIPPKRSTAATVETSARRNNICRASVARLSWRRVRISIWRRVISSPWRRADLSPSHLVTWRRLIGRTATVGRDDSYRLGLDLINRRVGGCDTGDVLSLVNLIGRCGVETDRLPISA